MNDSLQMFDEINTDFINEIEFNMYTDSCYNEAEQLDTFYDLSGDEYADAILSTIA